MFNLRLPVTFLRGAWIPGVAAAAFFAAGGPVKADPGLEFFENKVRPVLSGQCYECHSGKSGKSKGGLTLDTREGLLKGGTDGEVVVPGNPDASLLIRAVRHEDSKLRMPPPGHGEKLPDAAIQDLTRWVKMGAPFPETPPEQRRVVPKPWSFEPVKDPASPVVRDTSWPLTSVDPFILEKIESRGLRPSPRAEKRTLIRRATYDLTGMPPEPEEVDRFLADPAPDAFTRLVDRLLASPRYGEHWGRHWLDVVRYADTAGDTADYPVPEAWRYRNYVIDSFNADKPYDEFIREQIAGDIMAGQGPPDKYAERVTATGYLALSRRFGFDSENYQHLTIQDAIDTMGQSVLGLTTGCARCHDHKFDPISTQDYYGLYGIFESTRFSFPGSEQKGKYRAMVPLVSAGESRAKWQEMQARFVSLGVMPASILRSLDDMDGDFEMQRAAAGGSNGVLVPPWLYEGRVSVSQAAQSPFRHLHPFGIAGASVAPDAGGYGIRQALHPARAKGVVYVNLEFRVAADAAAAQGRHRFLLGTAGGPPTVEVFLSSGRLTFPGAAPLEIPLPQPGGWHCLQLALNLDSRTFTGSFGVPGRITDIVARPFGPDFAGSVDYLAFDSKGSQGPLPGLEVDNIGVQETPLAPVSTTPAKPPGAPPTLADLKAELETLSGADGDLEAQTNGAAPALTWHPGPNSAVRVSSASQSPFTNLFPEGTQGLHVPATPAGGYNGFGNRLPKTWTQATTGRLEAGFDFQCEPGGTGTWRFHIGHSHVSPAVQLAFNSTTLFRRSGDAWDNAAPILAGGWHQVRLIMDLKAKTYTGSVTTRAGKTEFSGTFAPGWDGTIDYLYIDSGGHLPGAKPAFDADNFIVPETPLPPLEAAEAPPAGDLARQARLKELRAKIAAPNAEEEHQRRELDAWLAGGPVPLAYGVTEGTPHNARVQIRGEPDKPGVEVARGFIQVLGHAALPREETGSGRLALARWLTRPDNPLTARVMVNRLWQYHFGHGLVRTPNDFGTRSERPTHPELLDHLAAEFVRGGWSVKAMHRLILLSATWQQASVFGDPMPEAATLYTAFPRRRLGAEEIRDAILSVSGTLDPSPGKGHPFPPAPTWGYSQHGPFSALYDHDKRSVYLMVQRIKRHPYLALFDGADPNSSTAERRVTTVPTQALYFMNDPFVHAKSVQCATRLRKDAAEERGQIMLAYRLALGRPAEEDEIADAVGFLSACRAELTAAGKPDPALLAMAAFVRTLFGSNEFLHCD